MIPSMNHISSQLTQDGDNAREAYVVWPWALLGPSLRDFDPYVCHKAMAEAVRFARQMRRDR